MEAQRHVAWIDPAALAHIPEIRSRNLFARKNARRDASELVQKYTGLTVPETRVLFTRVLSELGISLRGTGIELGAGVGGVSNALLSLFQSIDKIYAVEIVPEVVTLLQSKVTRAEKNENRVISVIGSFDDIRLPDNSVDFAIEFDSLHHSSDLQKTLREVARVLKPGGVIVAIDRMHTNALSDAQRRYMLNVEYGEPFKNEYGIPIEERLTREDNGEHEIREREWREAFAGAGLELRQCVTFHRKGLRWLICGAISILPFPLRARYRLQPMLSRFPAAFFLLYVFPFFPFLWRTKYRPLKLQCDSPGAFRTKTVFAAYKKQ